MNLIWSIIALIIPCGIVGTIAYAFGHIAGHEAGQKLEERQTNEYYQRFIVSVIREDKAQLQSFMKFWDEFKVYWIWSNLEEYAEKRVHAQYRNIERSAKIKESNEYLLSVINNYATQTKLAEEVYLDELMGEYSRSETRSYYLIHYVINSGAYRPPEDDYSPLAKLSKLIKVQSSQFEIGLLLYSAQQQMTSVAKSLERLTS
jgi:hypothetical protein